MNAIPERLRERAIHVMQELHTCLAPAHQECDSAQAAIATALHEIEQAARIEGERRAWQPIETAPRDGTRVLGSDQECVEVIYWARDGWFNQSAEISMWRVWPPTHWQPLPAPPALPAKE